MESPERVVCCTLCLCMAVAVFSSVAFVYLTALVYMPAKREINSGLSDIPVMCKTIERTETDHCDWYSCGEWCLSKSSNCIKLWAQVRKNGTNIQLRGCKHIEDITCKVMDNDFVEDKVCYKDEDCHQLNDRFLSKCSKYQDCGHLKNPFRCDAKFNRCVSIRNTRNCKNDDVCNHLNRLFMCEEGLCQNISTVYDCTYDKVVNIPVDCHDKRNCLNLQGLFDCQDGVCHQVEWPWICERRCQLLSTSHDQNVVILSGDRMLSAKCQTASNLITGANIWKSHRHGEDVLMASCTDLSAIENNEVNDDSVDFLANDCVNGTLMPRAILPPNHVNYTLINKLFQDYGKYYKLGENDVDHIPFENDIIIYNHTKILINTEGCVNTLQEECTLFYLEHRKDGRNFSANDIFPCYYTPHHDLFVTTRFSIGHTKSIFLISFAIPATLWIFSCSCLFGCSKLIRVEESGQMKIRCRKDDEKDIEKSSKQSNACRLMKRQRNRHQS